MTDADIYPIGRYQPAPFSPLELNARLGHVHRLPRLLEAAVHDLNADELQQPYREGSWSIHQLVHHVSDSHLVAFLRTKLILTVDGPTLPTYPQEAFAQLPDVAATPINHSLTQLHVIHAKWYEILSHVDEAAWERGGYHPELESTITLWYLLGLYAWHGRHHATQILLWREANGR